MDLSETARTNINFSFLKITLKNSTRLYGFRRGAEINGRDACPTPTRKLKLAALNQLANAPLHEPGRSFRRHHLQSPIDDEHFADTAVKAAGLSESELNVLEESGKISKQLNFSLLAQLIGLNGAKLEKIALGWLPAESDLSRWRELRQITTTKDYAVNCYLVWDEISCEAALFELAGMQSRFSKS